jgi:hypothetical protein
VLLKDFSGCSVEFRVEGGISARWMSLHGLAGGQSGNAGAVVRLGLQVADSDLIHQHPQHACQGQAQV